MIRTIPDSINRLSELSHPWTGAMGATMFTSWIYDFLKPYPSDLKIANPQMLKAIADAKKKNDKVDVRMMFLFL